MRKQTDPQTPLYFYLSYAQTEDKSKIEQFFKDLSDSIRVRAGLPLIEIVGCGDAFAKDAGAREVGLRTSRLLLALLSPSYFRDKTAGREWQIFEMRKALSDPTDTEVIIPISWLPYSGSMPVVISQTPVFDGNGGHTKEPVTTMLRSRGKLRHYAEFVNNLANYIVDSIASFQLPEMDSIPDEVPNAFETGAEPPANSQTNTSMPHKILNQNLLIIDGAFAKSIAEQLKETADRPAPVSQAGPSGQASQATKVAAEKYLVFTIDDQAKDLQKIETTARFSRDFEVKVYTDSNQLLEDVSELSKNREEPDLIVVNPALTVPGTHRHKLIDALLEKKVPSAILAIAKDPDAGRWLKLAGINDLVGTLPKSFTSVELLQLMRHWAKTGRDKRYRRGRSGKRPVFLSFASSDEAMASKICKWLELREIGVWYSFDTLVPGDPWIERIKQGLASAEVFIALISDDYPQSDFCQAELGIILDRLAKKPNDPLVIPVHYHSPTAALEDPQIQMCLDQQAVAISDKEWLLGCQKILETVRNFLNRRQNQS